MVLLGRVLQLEILFLLLFAMESPGMDHNGWPQEGQQPPQQQPARLRTVQMVLIGLLLQMEIRF
jgi:hypothetical protein